MHRHGRRRRRELDLVVAGDGLDLLDRGGGDLGEVALDAGRRRGPRRRARAAAGRRRAGSCAARSAAPRPSPPRRRRGPTPRATPGAARGWRAPASTARSATPTPPACRCSAPSAKSTSRTGKPILYTSADSVLQIAAHETSFGLERLYKICRIAQASSPTENRPGHRAALRRRAPATSSAPRTARISPSRRRSRRCSTVWWRPGGGRTPSARSATFSPIAASRRWQGARTTWRSSMPRSPRSTRPADGDLVFANFVDFDSLYGHAARRRRLCRRARGLRRPLPEISADSGAGIS